MAAQSLVIQQVKSFLDDVVEKSETSCEVEFSSGEVMRFGNGAAKFFVKLHSDKPLRHIMSEFYLGKAYVEGEFDIEGDMMSMLELRQHLKGKTKISILLKFLNYLFLKPASFVNKRAVAAHYSFGDDFFLAFMDKKYRFYSQCLFHSDDETLEQAAEHKLESMCHALQLKPGARLLDIGGGWGGCMNTVVLVVFMLLLLPCQRIHTIT